MQLPYSIEYPQIAMIFSDETRQFSSFQTETPCPSRLLSVFIHNQNRTRSAPEFHYGSAPSRPHHVIIDQSAALDRPAARYRQT
jgi:hypothetical protein